MTLKGDDDMAWEASEEAEVEVEVQATLVCPSSSIKLDTASAPWISEGRRMLILQQGMIKVRLKLLLTLINPKLDTPLQLTRMARCNL